MNEYKYITFSYILSKIYEEVLLIMNTINSKSKLSYYELLQLKKKEFTPKKENKLKKENSNVSFSRTPTSTILYKNENIPEDILNLFKTDMRKYELELKNPHERDNNIYLDEDTHTYYIRLFQNNEEYIVTHYMSSTTFAKKHFSKFDPDEVITKIFNSRNYNETNKYWGMSREEIKKMWSDSGKESSELGTKMHFDIEMFYNNIPQDNHSIEYSYFKNFHKDMLERKILPMKLTPYRTEWFVYDEDIEVAGAIDMTYIDEEGNIHIFDWKRSKKIEKENRYQKCKMPCLSYIPDCNYWHYSFQLNIYKYILERKYGKKVESMNLVVCHPDNDNYLHIPVNHLDDVMSKLVEDRKKDL